MNDKHFPPGSPKGGQFAPKGYNEQYGQYEDLSGNTNYNQTMEVKFADGTSKTIFNTNEFNPLEVDWEHDSDDIKVDKTIVMPLFIKNTEQLIQPFVDEGYQVWKEGFGHLKDWKKENSNDTIKAGDENTGIDYRIIFYHPERDEFFTMKIDFKFLKNNEFSSFEDPRCSLHLFRDSDERGKEAQFLNGKHKNNYYAFMNLDTNDKSLYSLLPIIKNGGDISQKIFGMKMMAFKTQDLRSNVFRICGNEQKLRNECLQQRELFRNGMVPSEEVVTWEYGKDHSPYHVEKVFSNPITGENYKITTKKMKNAGNKIFTSVSFNTNELRKKIPNNIYKQLNDREIKF